MPSSITQVIAARMPNDDAEGLRALAQQWDMSVSDTVRVLVDLGLLATADGYAEMASLEIRA